MKLIVRWHRTFKESFHQAESVSDLLQYNDILATRKGNDLYLHFLVDPKGPGVVWKKTIRDGGYADV
ncbi:hypothetical protein ACFQI7_12400 [Paenibacillus allorhizosphaerae]|uniref:Uncharacterized protein n=1 Tax=Paenibacillus allorhizosphaerae TaxID=2849866 RepID=A0ABN7TNG0_9BACL|nr:hypothetical protein [Paenibacillus allorhizosphaerae]CAG7648598.1 hypothetical protein PAECIP111802_04260 [Paenibacillus allorhizosphaerae]